jgi:cell division protein FtsN
MKTLHRTDQPGKSVRQQAGGFVMGLVAGLLIGLAVALGVALYITKAPSLFINKVPQRTAEQDTAETERNRNWDPNAPLSGKAGNHAAAAASGSVTVAPVAAASEPAASASAPAAPPVAVQPPPAPAVAAASAPVTAAPAARPAAKDPVAILNGGAAAPARDPYIYFVQTGAYTRNDDAEQQKAKLALIGQTARISEREQAGRVVYRVRLGPFPTRDEADALQTQLQQQSIEAQIVRVEKP